MGNLVFTFDKLEKLQLQKGHKWFTEPFEPNIIGVRSEMIVPNVYNDLMMIAYLDNKGKKQLFSYTQTTLPGKFWLNNPAMPGGTAVLVHDKQYLNCWIKGDHGKTRPHDALIQFAGPVDIWRDNNKNDIPEWEGMVKYTNQYIGCNIHASWAIADRKFIDKDSAACQVANNNWNHEKMMKDVIDERIKKVLGVLPSNKEILENKKLWVPFSYTLFHEKTVKSYML